MIWMTFNLFKFYGEQFVFLFFFIVRAYGSDIHENIMRSKSFESFLVNFIIFFKQKFDVHVKFHHNDRIFYHFSIAYFHMIAVKQRISRQNFKDYIV